MALLRQLALLLPLSLDHLQPLFDVEDRPARRFGCLAPPSATMSRSHARLCPN